jgi:hypothetical protein
VVCSDLTVVTNALHAATTVREGGSRVIVLGGLLTPELSLVNPGIAQEPTQVKGCSPASTGSRSGSLRASQ